MASDQHSSGVAPAQPKARLLYVDNLRVVLGVIVIVFHLAISYGGAGDWGYKEDGPITMPAVVLLTMFLGINQAYFMGLYFMLSGAFTPGAYDRKGAGAFVVDRLKRLGIPLLLFRLVLLPPVAYLLRRHDGFQGSLWQHLAEYYGGFDSIGDGPVWFLGALLVFSLVYALWRLATRNRPAPASRSPRPQVAAPNNLQLVLFGLALGVVTFVVRIGAPVGWNWEPLHWQLAHFAQYIALFIVGLVAYRNGWLEGIKVAQGRLWRWVVVALVILMPVLMVVGGALEGNFDSFMGGLAWQSLAFAVWEQLMCVAMIVTLVVWFRERFNRQRALARAMSGAAYATYVFFAPVIYLLALAFSPVQWDMALKFLIASPIAVALCFVVGYLVRKIPGAKAIF